MTLSAPKQITWLIAVLLAVVGLIAQLVSIPVLSGIAFWLVLASAILLALGTYLKGL